MSSLSANWGVMFWLLGPYTFYILKYIFNIFENFKKVEIRNSCVHLHVLHAYKVVARQINMPYGVCKKDKIWH
jgi:hypothetical protein